MWPFGRDRHARDVPAGENGAMERDESAETGANWVAGADDALPAEADGAALVEADGAALVEADGAALVEAEAELEPDESDELESNEPEPEPTLCPECGGPRIVANVRGDLRLAYRESMFGLGIMSNTSVYALVCRTCGLTTLYAYDPAAVFPLCAPIRGYRVLRSEVRVPMIAPDLLAPIFIVLSLLILLAGSVLIVVAFVGGTPNPETPYDLGIGVGYAIALLWPLVLAVVWFLDALALLMHRRLAAVVFLFLMLAGVWALVQRLLYRIALMSGGSFPKRGLPAVLVLLIFLAVNIGAFYVAWRYILGDGIDALFA